MSTDTTRPTVALWSPKWNQVIQVAEHDVQTWIDKGCTVVTADFVPPVPSPPAPQANPNEATAPAVNADAVITAPVSDIVAPNEAEATAPATETPATETANPDANPTPKPTRNARS